MAIGSNADNQPHAKMPPGRPSLGAIRSQRRHWQRKRDLDEGLQLIQLEMREYVTDMFQELRSELVSAPPIASTGLMQRMEVLESGLLCVQEDLQAMASTCARPDCKQDLIDALSAYGVPKSEDMRALLARISNLEMDVDKLQVDVDAARLSPPTPSEDIKVGCSVFLTGLSSTHLNGLPGVVISAPSNDGRYGVRISGQGDKLVRRSNLEHSRNRPQNLTDPNVPPTTSPKSACQPWNRRPPRG